MLPFHLDTGITPPREITDEEFHDYCNLIESADRYLNPELYLFEKVLVPGNRVAEDIGVIINQTVSRDDDIYGIWKDTTDAGATLIRNVWNLLIKLIKIIVHIITGMVDMIVFLPRTISKTIDLMGKVSDAVRAKVTGSIRLNFTAADIENIFVDGIMGHISEFLNTTKLLLKSDTWTGFKDGTIKKVAKAMPGVRTVVKAMGTGDRSICHQVIKKAYTIQHIRLEKSYIELKDPRVKKIYLSNEKVISFMDGVTNQKFNGSFLESLNMIIMDLDEYKSTLSNIKDELDGKINNSRFKGEFGQLDLTSKKTIVATIKCTANAITSIGKIIRGVREDVGTIQVAINKMTQKK